ncbi:hypothetical protein [Streptomyces sp. NPDC017941]|uniref:hypothetical protein n=1 Tax=Streptomyces sp. NPDC017941 TaxID=3365018 RepID=UPI0037AC95E1
MRGYDVLVRCPVCRHEQIYAPPAFPCPCGAPVVPPVTHGSATALTHRTPAGAWVRVRCAACGRGTDWPRPELGCACGAVLRIPVAAEGPGAPGRVPVHGARDVVTTAVLFLRRLGYEDVREARPDEERPPSGTRLTALGVLAQIEPTARPLRLRDVECAWLTAMTHAVTCVCFAVAGFTPGARARADELGVALFRIARAGTPEPLNGAADELTATGT